MKINNGRFLPVEDIKESLIFDHGNCAVILKFEALSPVIDDDFNGITTGVGSTLWKGKKKLKQLARPIAFRNWCRESGVSQDKYENFATWILGKKPSSNVGNMLKSMSNADQNDQQQASENNTEAKIDDGEAESQTQVQSQPQLQPQPQPHPQQPPQAQAQPQTQPPPQKNVQDFIEFPEKTIVYVKSLKLKNSNYAKRLPILYRLWKPFEEKESFIAKNLFTSGLDIQFAMQY